MLSGISILDLSLQIPGPYATLLLRHLGARVIKVEPPGGDPARVIDPYVFAVLNHGSERITLNLRSACGKGIMGRLVSRADVLIEGFRPGVADRLGIAYLQLKELYPRLVYCSISGFGQAGPYRDLAGHDINYLGIGGGIGGAAPPTEIPAEGMPIEMPMIDLAMGSMACSLILAALRERDGTGRARYLDVAMLDQAVFWSCLKAGWALAPSLGRSAPRGEPTYGAFRAADGRYLTIGLLEDKFWPPLCEALDWSDWRDDPKLASYDGRKQEARQVVARLKETIATRPRDLWLAALGAAGLSVAPVHSFHEVPVDPQVVVRGLFARAGGDDLLLRPPLPPDCRRDDVVPAADPLAQRAALLDELGYRPAEQEALAAAGAFG